MHKWTVILLMALTGLVFFSAFAMQDIRIHQEMSWSDLPWSLILRYGLAMTFGGALAGALLSGLFGRSGAGGWILALLGGLIASLVIGLFGSAFGLLPDLLIDGYNTSDLVKTALGALVVPLSIIEQPWLLIVLAVLVFSTHLRARYWRGMT